MKITLEIKNEYLSNLKYLFLVLMVISFIAYVYFFELPQLENNMHIYLLLATVFAIYMAINLWANDVANNMWPAVWAKALTLTWAIIIAMIFEASGALIAGWDVVDTIKWGIIDANMIDKTSIEFIAIMLATLLGSAIWVNIATFFKAPVSITHSIFWWLIWAWITSSGIYIVNWWMVWKVAAAWVVAILMWAFFAIALFISIRKTILKKQDRWEAAKNWVPVYVSVMVSVFSMYLILKWFKYKLTPLKDFLVDKWFDFTTTAIFVSIIIGFLVYSLLMIHFKKQKESFFKDKKKFVNKLFNLPLIFAVALLSFAHWANDVANAIWPLAAIYDAVKTSWLDLMNSTSKIWVPFWIMLLWAIFLSTWLAVFGSRLIKTVWNEITKIDQSIAYCIALSAAITVLIASAMWIPVSTTQIALWWVFWVWLYRQYLKTSKWKDKKVIENSKLKSIVLSWLVTLPIAWIISSFVYLFIIYLAK